MESRPSRKRPWEDDGPADFPYGRRESILATPTASLPRQGSPLPHEAGSYSRDSRVLNQRRLPPLYMSSRDTPAGLITSSSAQNPARTQQPLLSYNPRPRSQSLFNAYQHSHGQDHQHYEDHPIDYNRTLESGTSPPALSTEVHRSQLGSGPAPHAARVSSCCPPSCQGQECLTIRTLTRKLAAELTLLDHKVNLVTRTEHHSSDQLLSFEHLYANEVLQRALDLVQCSSLNLQDHLERRSRNPERLPQPDATPSMRRSQHHLEEREEQPPSSRHYPNVHHGYSGFSHPNMIPEESRRPLHHGGGMSSRGNSPYHTTSSPGSAFMPLQSPMQAPQPIRTAILPSPSSLNFQNAPTLPSITPPSAAAQTSAQSAHLQDLQHQISVKTLAFQTLQREYDSLLQKLERQRTKCATLEKKFEVSDVEINSLTEEKERLQAQVTTLEAQVEELQQSRDEARRQLAANGAQYMRIMEMASRLQGQGAEDKKKWQAEKTELEQRIRTLEEAMVIGTDDASFETENRPSASPGATSLVRSYKSVTPSAPQSETIIVLRTEVGRLRSRTHTLETALQTMRQESLSIQAAARQLVESGGRLEGVAQDAVGNGG